MYVCIIVRERIISKLTIMASKIIVIKTWDYFGLSWPVTCSTSSIILHLGHGRLEVVSFQ